ncbi:MAG: hypothetical protein HY996_04195 [Micrococcales bacterium]|nr:hypothetical protein [Micrococcales bacterium]
MSTPLTARDLWAIIVKLPHDEQVRLARMALHAAARGGGADAAAYGAVPPEPDEFSCEDDPLAWESDGWEDLDASR